MVGTKNLIAIVLLAVLAGCAIGSASPERGVSGYAFGQAKIEQCQLAVCEGSQDCKDPCVCARIEGGSLSVTIAGVLTAGIAAALAYFGLPF